MQLSPVVVVLHEVVASVRQPTPAADARVLRVLPAEPATRPAIPWSLDQLLAPEGLPDHAAVERVLGETCRRSITARTALPALSAGAVVADAVAEGSGELGVATRPTEAIRSREARRMVRDSTIGSLPGSAAPLRPGSTRDVPRPARAPAGGAGATPASPTTRVAELLGARAHAALARNETAPGAAAYVGRQRRSRRWSGCSCSRRRSRCRDAERALPGPGRGSCRPRASSSTAAARWRRGSTSARTPPTTATCGWSAT